MPILKLVIADDEPLARERLRMLLADEAGVEVVAEAGDGQQVLDACAALHPHAVLLDIAMPGLDGLETARRLAGLVPPTAVVFCTAYDEHALSAFEAAALDYLVSRCDRSGWRPHWSAYAPIMLRARSRKAPGAPSCVLACAAACG